MTHLSKFLPHPLQTLSLTVVWLLLVNSIAPGHIFLGAALGVLIPLFTNIFWTEKTKIGKLDVLIGLCLTVLWDIVVANVVVARRILGPTDKLRPSFITLSLDLSDPLAITLLMGIISLTPGTVSADLHSDRTTLLIHCLDLDDRDAMVNRIKERYEAPLKEIFQC